MHTKIFRRVCAIGHQLAHKWFRKKKKIFIIYLKPFCKCAIVSKNIYIFYKNCVTFYRGLWGTVKMYKLTPSHLSPLCSLQRSGWWAHNKLCLWVIQKFFLLPSYRTHCLQHIFTLYPLVFVYNISNMHVFIELLIS